MGQTCVIALFFGAVCRRPKIHRNYAFLTLSFLRGVLASRSITMQFRILPLITLLLLATGFTTAVGQSSSRDQRFRQELQKANKEYDTALVRGDADALNRLYADEFVYTTFDGSVRDKQQQLAFTRYGDLRLDSGESDDVNIRIYGNTAVMTGRFTARGKFKGKELNIRERYTAVWVRKKGRWQLVAEQGNEIKS